MKAILTRLRRLEVVRAPNDQVGSSRSDKGSEKAPLGA